MLNGEKGEERSKFKPLNSSSVPYRVFGMINMCDSEKVIEVDRRVLVYYKYDFESINCVKVFRNIHRTQLNIRFLQVRLLLAGKLSSHCLQESPLVFYIQCSPLNQTPWDRPNLF